MAEKESKQEKIEKEILKEATEELKKEKTAKEIEKEKKVPKPKEKKTLIEKAKETVEKVKKPEEKEAKLKFERIYTFPLRTYRPRGKRARLSMAKFKKLVSKHTKASEIKISSDVNEYIWKKGLKKPPPRVKVLIQVYDDGKALVKLK